MALVTVAAVLSHRIELRCRPDGWVKARVGVLLDLTECDPRVAGALSAWHLRYCPQEGLEMRARLMMETKERMMREARQEVTIHALYVALANRGEQLLKSVS